MARLYCGSVSADFGEVIHHGGISPAWPLRYEDFEPYYTKAEQLYHVHGQRGSIRRKAPPARRIVIRP